MSDIEQIYGEYSTYVYRYLLSLCQNAQLAEELTQETFYRAVYSIKTYDGSCKISVWLCQIAKHVWYRELQKQKQRRTEPLHERIASQDELLEDNAIDTDNRVALYKAIHQLDEPMREVVHMRVSGEFSFAEIGEVLGRTENWARVTFYRAKQKLMKGLKEQDD